MEALFQWLIGMLETLWPFRQVEPWEKGVYIVNGKCKGVVGPGYTWPVIPWFIHVEPLCIVPAPLGTPLLNVFSSDGMQVSFSVCAMVCVVDPIAALTKIEDYRESTQELVTAAIAEGVGMMEADRVTELRRTELADRFIPKINKQLAEFGVECQDLWFTNLGVEVRTFRLLMDEALTGASW